jgi:aerobic carbon-monoxide dehydrogenase medium subunit
VRRCGIGLIGLGAAPVRASEAEDAAVGATVTDVDADELGRRALAGLDEIPSDLHGSAAYRRRVGAAMVARAWAAATTEARNG